MVDAPPEMAALREHFANEPLFLEVINAILELDHGTKLQERKRAWHRASQYAIEDGQLWHIGGGMRIRARLRQECVTKAEAVELAWQEHEGGGHWHRDSIQTALLDHIHCPGLDACIVSAILAAKVLADHTYTHCSTQSRGATPSSYWSETTFQCQSGKGASTTSVCILTPTPNMFGVSCSRKRAAEAQR